MVLQMETNEALVVDVAGGLDACNMVELANGVVVGTAIDLCNLGEESNVVGGVRACVCDEIERWIIEIIDI
jgi:hypothetical protein